MAGKVAGHKGPGFGSFKGRAGRGEWWSSLFWNSLIGGAVGLVPAIGVVLSAPWTIGLLATTARRLHDLRQSGWWQVVPMVVTVCLFGAWLGAQKVGHKNFFLPDNWASALFACSLLPYLGFYGWIGIAPAKRGPNVYGEADA